MTTAAELKAENDKVAREAREKREAAVDKAIAEAFNRESLTFASDAEKQAFIERVRRHLALFTTNINTPIRPATRPELEDTVRAGIMASLPTARNPTLNNTRTTQINAQMTNILQPLSTLKTELDTEITGLLNTIGVTGAEAGMRKLEANEALGNDIATELARQNALPPIAATDTAAIEARKTENETALKTVIEATLNRTLRTQYTESVSTTATTMANKIVVFNTALQPKLDALLTGLGIEDAGQRQAIAAAVTNDLVRKTMRGQVAADYNIGTILTVAVRDHSNLSPEALTALQPRINAAATAIRDEIAADARTRPQALQHAMSRIQTTVGGGMLGNINAGYVTLGAAGAAAAVAVASDMSWWKKALVGVGLVGGALVYENWDSTKRAVSGVLPGVAGNNNGTTPT